MKKILYVEDNEMKITHLIRIEDKIINTFNNLSPSFGEIIKPGKDYTGLDYFFSNQSKIDQHVKFIDENKLSKIRKKTKHKI